MITNEQLTRIKERAEKYAYGPRYQDSAEIFAQKACEDILRLGSEVERLHEEMNCVDDVVKYVRTQLAQEHFNDILTDESIEDFIDQLDEVIL